MTASPPPDARARYLVLTLLTATQVGSALLASGIGSIMPFIAQVLALNKTRVGLIAGVMGVTWIVVSPIAGVVVDRFGERRVILWSGAVTAAVLVLAAAYENYAWLLFWLIPYAVMMCFQTPAGGRAVLQWFTRDRALAMGIRQMGVPVGGFLGAVMLAPIAARFGYPASIFACAVFVVAVSLPILFVRSPERATGRGQRFRLLWRRMREISRDRRCVLMSLTQMCHSVGQSCMTAFLTISLIATARFDLPTALAAFALAQVGSILGRIVWGILSDFLWDGDRMLPTMCACALGAGCAVILGLHYAEPGLGVKVLLCTAAFVFGFTIAACNGIFAMAQSEVVGLENAGSPLGVAAGRSAVSMALSPPPVRVTRRRDGLLGVLVCRRRAPGARARPGLCRPPAPARHARHTSEPTGMSKLNVKRIAYALGAAVTGVDLRERLDDATVAEIRQAWLDHQLLCFPGQNLTPPQFKEFCGRFGELDDNRRSPHNRHPEDGDVMVLSNKPVEVAGKQAGGYAIADKWHSDLSFTNNPSTATFLLSKGLPEIGGNTMFNNMYMAYETLSPGMQKLICNLEAVHDARLGPTYLRAGPELRASIHELNPPVVHPVVREHPETHRKALYAGDRVSKFVGMTEEETRPILDFLNTHAIRYEFVYRHVWSLHDLVMWDNRCTMHFAVQDYDRTAARWMLRCSLLGPESGRLYSENGEAAATAGASKPVAMSRN